MQIRIAGTTIGSFAGALLNAPRDQFPKRFQRDLPCQSVATKIFLLPRRGKSVAYLRPSHPIRGAGRDRHERGLRCGGRGSVGRASGIAGQVSCERSTGARTNGASTPSPKLRQPANGRPERVVEVAAYGEDVWSWHPLLMSNLR